MPADQISTGKGTRPNGASYALPITMICVLFFVFGFVTWANSTWIQFFKVSFSLTDTQSFLVTFSAFIAYFFLALPSSVILKKTGFSNGIVIGLLILAFGSLLFIPAASARSFSLFLVAIFVQGVALALLQTAANPYLSILGPIESAARRISLAGISNKVAGIIVPFVMGSFFLANAGVMEEQIARATNEADKILHVDALLSRVYYPSVLLALFFLVLAFVFVKVKLPGVEVAEENSDASADRTSIFQFPHLFLGALCIFMCQGAEVMAGDIIGVYGKAMGLSPETSNYLTSFTLICMLLGYLAGVVAIPKYISQQKALKVCAVLGIIFSLAAYLAPGFASLVFVAMLGLANSLMWPAIFPLGIRGLGRFTKTGSAIMIMGIAGAAVWPLLYGLLKDTFHVHYKFAYFITVLPCYIYIIFFSVKGYKVTPRPGAGAAINANRR